MSYYDYYNYENYNYLLKLLNDENIIDETKYMDYLLSKEDKKDLKKNNNIIKYKKDNNYLKNYDNLEYLKENIFYAHENDFLKLFEFKDFSFSTISTFNLKNYNISDINPSKNSDYFLFPRYKSIKFLEYDLIKKSISMSQKEINDFDSSFIIDKCLDLKDGSIIAFRYNNIDIWKQESKNNEKNFNDIIYKKIISIDNVFSSIFNNQYRIA